MQNFAYSLLFLGVICVQKALGQQLTAEEKRVGLAIASKLSELTRPKIQPGLKSVAAGGSRLGVSRSALSGPQYLDIQLVVDSSGSIGASNYEAGKEATETVVEFINGKAAFTPSGSRAALIEFSSPRLTSLVFGFGDHVYAYGIKNQINSLSYDNGPSTATALALSKAKTEFQQNPNTRNAKVIWIFTDGKSNTGGNPVTVANQLKSMGVTICAVPVGSSVNMAEINAISSSGCVYKMTSFQSYKRVMQYALKSQGGGASAPVLDPGFFKGIKF